MTQNIIGIPKITLAESLNQLGLEKFRAKQIWQWLYQRGVKDFELMSNLSKANRQLLGENFYIGRPTISKDLNSIDGTRKFLMKFEDGQEIETVFIPSIDRGSLCMSSQVGCSLTCSFCHTGTQKLTRNLTAADIVGQFMAARDAFNDWGGAIAPKNTRISPYNTTKTPQNYTISNIIMMGMGEPLLNYDNVSIALKIIMDEDGINLSKRRITLSTSGIVSKIQECGEDLGVNLAVSLHAVRDDLRDELVPINKKWPIEQLLNSCRDYYGENNFRRVTFEYVMLKDINDSEADAYELVNILKGINAKINLIPFNPWPGSKYECSTPEQIQKFANILNKNNLNAPIRTPRGRDIMAACGQLKSDSVRLKMI